MWKTYAVILITLSFFLISCKFAQAELGINIKENHCTDGRIQRLRRADGKAKRIADLRFLLLQPIRPTKGTHFDPRGNRSFHPRSGIAFHRSKGGIYTQHTSFWCNAQRPSGRKVKYKEGRTSPYELVYISKGSARVHCSVHRKPNTKISTVIIMSYYLCLNFWMKNRRENQWFIKV